MVVLGEAVVVVVVLGEAVVVVVVLGEAVVVVVVLGQAVLDVIGLVTAEASSGLVPAQAAATRAKATRRAQRLIGDSLSDRCSIPLSTRRPARTA